MEWIKIMLVDDEERFLSTTKTLLARHGYEAFTATSGEEALALMKERLFDVVLLDVKMPGMDGIETLKEMKKMQPLAEVILLTGHASVETSIDGMKLGAFDYLLKPVKLEDLLVKLADAFEKKNSHEEKIRTARIRELIGFPGRILGQEKEEDVNEQ